MAAVRPTTTSPFNFVVGGLSEARCRSPSADGYSVNNLVAGGSFLTDGFVQPPVEVLVEFRVPVKLSEISFSPKVSTHCSDNLSVFVSGHPGFNVSDLSNRQVWVRIASLRDLNGVMNRGLFPFIRIVVSEEYSLQNGGNTSALDENGVLRLTPNFGFGKIQEIRGIAFRITRAYGSRCIGLERLQVIGTLGHSAGLRDIEAVRTARHLMSSPRRTTGYKRMLRGDDEEQGDNKRYMFQSNGTTKDSVAAASQKEFFDPITGTLMMDPVILPSGNILDRSSFTHFLTHKSDPFTRQPLDMDSVVPAAALKANIQSFVANQSQQNYSHPSQLGPQDFVTVADAGPSTVPVHSKRLPPCAKCREDIKAPMEIEPCRHLLCRSCALAIDWASSPTQSCPVCESPFQRHHLMRVFNL